MFGGRFKDHTVGGATHNVKFTLRTFTVKNHPEIERTLKQKPVLSPGQILVNSDLFKISVLKLWVQKVSVIFFQCCHNEPRKKTNYFWQHFWLLKITTSIIRRFLKRSTSLKENSAFFKYQGQWKWNMILWIG